MRGHQPLIDMRRNGVLPSEAVWVTDAESPFEEWFAKNWHGHAPFGTFTPYILVEERDVIETLDFRCLRGLIVHLQGHRSEARAQRLFGAIRKVQPRAIACCRKSEMWIYQASEGGNGKRIRA